MRVPILLKINLLRLMKKIDDIELEGQGMDTPPMGIEYEEVEELLDMCVGETTVQHLARVKANGDFCDCSRCEDEYIRWNDACEAS
jgi:hypothetical protein